MIYTNVNINKMINELENHFKNIKNKEYIKQSLLYHLQNDFITSSEYTKLYNEYIKKEEEEEGIPLF